MGFTHWDPPSCEELLYSCCDDVVQESNPLFLHLILSDGRPCILNYHIILFRVHIPTNINRLHLLFVHVNTDSKNYYLQIKTQITNLCYANANNNCIRITFIFHIYIYIYI